MTDITEQISKNNKIMMLAYDQGFEHGPATDFNEKNYDPNYILDIAENGGYTCVAMQYGLASKFWLRRKSKVPLVLKMNGKTSLGKEALSLANSDINDALALGAKAIGYTIYLGSKYEAMMLREFSKLRDSAHKHEITVIAWMYPFITPPSSNDDELEHEIVAYAARTGAELGADIVKIKYPHQPDKLQWIIQNAVGTKAILSGGDKTDTEEQFLEKVRNFIDAGGSGAAIGRNIWQHHDPIKLSSQIKSIIWQG